MSPWTDGEKKGLTVPSETVIKNQGLLYVMLAGLAATSPKVVKVQIERKPVLADILNTSNVAVGETLSNQVALELKETKPLALNRAEQPIFFDIVSLTRNIAEEQVSIAPTQFGESREAEGDDYDQDEGERDDPFE